VHTSDTALRVENLGKRYRIGKAFQRSENWRQALLKTATAPFRYLGTRMRKATSKEILWALREVSFEVKQGEVVGIIGRNGAGKSTLLKILSRITDPSEGSAEIHGRVNSLLEVGTGFHPELTGRENIYLAAAIHGMRRSEVDRKFDEMVDFAGVSKFIDTPLKRYSSGMGVRLGFAVAANLESEVLLVDEVLAVGDIEFQKKCLGRMQAVAGAGRTVLFVSHKMEAVESLCERVILLDQGRVAMDGPSLTVLDAYVNTALDQGAFQTMAERSDRQGSGEYRYDRVWFTDVEGRTITAAKPGSPLRIHLRIAASSHPRAMRVNASAGVHDRRGFRVFSLGTSLLGRRLDLTGDSTLTWSIDSLPLCPGVYRCNVFLSQERSRDVVDWIQDAFVLPVGPGDFFGTGGKASAAADKVYVSHSCRLEKADDGKAAG